MDRAKSKKPAALSLVNIHKYYILYLTNFQKISWDNGWHTKWKWMNKAPSVSLFIYGSININKSFGQDLAFISITSSSSSSGSCAPFYFCDRPSIIIVLHVIILSPSPSSSSSTSSQPQPQLLENTSFFFSLSVFRALSTDKKSW